jgi:hypothetical protein
MSISKSDIKKYKALKKYYQKEEIPIEAVMDQLHLGPEAAVELVEYIKHPPKPVKPVVPIVIDPVSIPEPAPLVKRDRLIAILRWPMLLFAAGAFFLSCYFSIDALSKRQPVWIAWLMGAVLIGFGLISFELSVYYKRQKNKNWWIFGTAWLLILIYSINTTTSSFYDRWTMRETVMEASTASDEASVSLLASYETQEVDKKTLIADKRIRLANFQATLKKYEDPELTKGAEYNNATWGAISLEKEIVVLSKELTTITEQKNALLRENPAVKKESSVGKPSNYYEWVATIFKRFKVSADTLQFTVDLIPAVVLDLISSLALYVFLFLGKKPIDSEEKKK